MVVIPAIDILGGRCVRLTQGRYEQPTVYSEEPVAMAQRFAAAGATRIHVVDLDAARGSASNRTVIAQMVEKTKAEMQVAGGVRTEDAVKALLDGGAHAVVMATAAVRDPHLFERCAFAHPAQVIAGLDVRDNKAAVAGWLDTDPVVLKALVGRWADLPLAGVILTCIDRDGTMGGPDLETLGKVRKMTRLELQYSGGISSLDDIRRANAGGAQAVILGKALYEGRLRLEEALAL
ncbi:MAG: 1-(5-phosphoribosyl)-5-[(5-phosphoribosylamino)methylideneamino]imidazole-4-carboxamide isomerase [Cyanobacteria bacterium 13_1_20CM_4_61_6]|nr:MAG: 1-(5-phosphoribosyl)-5-[(5-phosphoribosylamino)methylideneamino]imidazole-4-carboxamide isomerase [Cyanobacteria bacterium 13_1_20CM_4_61_6]